MLLERLNDASDVLKTIEEQLQVGEVEWLNSETQGPGQGDTFASFALRQFLGYLLKVMF